MNKYGEELKLGEGREENRNTALKTNSSTAVTCYLNRKGLTAHTICTHSVFTLNPTSFSSV
jgi:hypothetical protein